MKKKLSPRNQVLGYRGYRSRISRPFLDRDLYLKVGDTRQDEKICFEKTSSFGFSESLITNIPTISESKPSSRGGVNSIRWKHIFRRKIMFQVFGVADHEYLVCYSIWTFNSRWETLNWIKKFFVEISSIGFLSSQVTNISSVSRTGPISKWETLDEIKKFFSLRNQNCVFTVADYEYLVRFPIWTFILSWGILDEMKKFSSPRNQISGFWGRRSQILRLFFGLDLYLVVGDTRRDK